MKEIEYIILTNRIKIEMAKEVLRGVLHGDEFGIDGTIYIDVMKGLHSLGLQSYRTELIIDKKEKVDDSKG